MDPALKRLLAVAATVAALVGPLGGTTAGAQDELEARVKAAFLYNFVKFVEWPANKFEALHSPIEICVHADDAFGEVMRATVQGKTAQGRGLVVHTGRPVSNPGACHLMYASGASENEIERVFAGVSGNSVLSVHAASRALRDGIVRFYIADNKVRIEINAAAADRSELKLSSKLLSVATIVRQ